MVDRSVGRAVSNRSSYNSLSLEVLGLPRVVALSATNTNPSIRSAKTRAASVCGTCSRNLLISECLVLVPLIHVLGPAPPSILILIFLAFGIVLWLYQKPSSRHADAVVVRHDVRRRFRNRVSRVCHWLILRHRG